ncbi:iron uptake transporter deferrochelatase/peroxidase subunit [Bradyrhizobium sp. dw_411]|uniref:iron uptake transporter deferrochelatase/peroxidase subunit n=1 Tax=Bradyrhizobium sp. dw_411 TaxID=2720082 RepID=UPI001BCEB554|nr:iron uptake transporter deferrochelatase/peroxidase subunit [Bradyrhizobium sp. dw_411]
MTKKQPPSDATEIASVTPTRRHLIAALGTASSIAALGVKPTPAAAADRTPDDESDGTLDAQPFFGRRQSGVVTPQPAAAMVAAFDVLADDRAGLEKMLRILTTRISVLTKAGPIPVLDPKLPPAESGLLGPRIYPDNLTMTVSVGASLFDDRFGIAAQKPKHLVTMERFTNDALDPKFCHGDLLLQICSNTAETNIHALRDIIKNLPDSIALRWKLDGFLPPHTIKRAGKDTVRNLLGFKDGTANLDGRDNALMDRVVWVQPGSDEPAWAADGSYQVVRIIRNLVERWDRTPLGEQEKIIGRHKMTGAPLSLAAEHDVPDYAKDPKGDRIPLDAHIRLANPRTRETEPSLILRRGFNFSRGISASGQLDMGLLFVCFQSNLDAGFLTVQKRLNNEPLEEYIKPTGGGYFFVLPGVADESRYLGQGLLEA